MKTKVSAFTIMEITIAMLIASIAIAITYTAFNLVNKSYLSFNLKNKTISELVLTDKLLNRDFMSANMINRTNGGIELIGKEGVITYKFTNAYILRNQYAIRTDTFFLSNNKLTCSFRNKEINTGQCLDNLKLESSLDNQRIVLNYYKLYSAEELSLMDTLLNK